MFLNYGWEKSRNSLNISVRKSPIRIYAAYVYKNIGITKINIYFK